MGKNACRRTAWCEAGLKLAAKTGRGTDALIQEAVGRLLAHTEWFNEQVQIGIDRKLY
jgi:hypothetical protein